MKNTVLLLLIVLGAWACRQDEEIFGISLPKENITFKPIEGGAVMYYRVPDNSEIFTIQAVYRDAFGEEITKRGSYLKDSLLLDGFNEARQGVPLRVSLRNNKDIESSALELTFDTKPSATYTFFDQADVHPYWNGFMLTYECPELVNGFANVFYIGTNPMTQQLDTLLLNTFQMESGRDTLFFPLEQKREKNTVIISTENFKGDKIRQKIWNDVEAYQVEKLEPKNFELLDPLELSVEDDEYKVGKKYLFDGDVKGTQRFQTKLKEYTFVMKPNSVGKHVILDLKEAKVVAKMRLYGMLVSSVAWMDSPIWSNAGYADKLPSEVTIYASNDPNDESSWKKMGHYYQSPVITETSWSYRCSAYDFEIKSDAEMLATDPCYMEVPFIVDENPYRYYKIVVNNTSIEENWYYNELEEVTYHELEVYAKKD